MRNKTTSTSICASFLTILEVLLNIFPPLRAVKSFPTIATEYLPALASGCMPFDFRPLIKCFRVLLDLPLYLPALNIRLEPKCVPQLFVRSLLGTRRSMRLSAIGQFFLSPWQQSQNSLRRLTRPSSLSKVTNWFCCYPDFAKKR